MSKNRDEEDATGLETADICAGQAELSQISVTRWKDGAEDVGRRRYLLLCNNAGVWAQRWVIAGSRDPAHGPQHALSQGLCPHPVPYPCVRLPAEIRG